MRLANFERLLTKLGGDTSDHVFHSFRVFLAGCPIVSRFYDQIQRAHRRLAICPDRNLRVEYSWLIASLFHDIGRVREGMSELVEQVGGDEFNVVRGSPDRWKRDDYQQARRILGSLGAHVAARGNASWDGGACEDRRGIELSGAWIELYNSYKIHGVIGAFDLLADVFNRMPAASERRYRPFTVSHVAPAALAVLLHDYRTWEPAKDWGLFPVSMDRNPLASLLIYLDTWDDFKRRPGSPPIAILNYVVDDTGATVLVEWPSAEALEKELHKYRNFSQALTGGPPLLKIKTQVRRR
jgi:hypothetical protein